MWRACALVISLFALSPPAEARHVQTTKIRYVTDRGKSQWYTVDVTYLTGVELNEATSSFHYDGLKSYAVVFWGQGQATVIRVKDIWICGFQVEASCLPTFGTSKGNDQEGREWELCMSATCF